MPQNINSVVLVGNLTKDPELRHTPSGTAVTTLRVAVNDRVETVFLMTSEESFYVSSSLVKEVATMGGDITRIAPPAVVEAFKQLKDGRKK